MQASQLVPMPSQPSFINVIQTSNTKGNQQSKGKKKGCARKKKDGKGNANKPDNYARGVTNESKKKVKFPCKLCNGDHLTHLFPKIQDAQQLLV